MTPRYQELKDHIISLIARGELREGDRVPSEHELSDSMQVSRMTANRALRELTSEGYVHRVAGSGTFVSDVMARSDVLEVHDIAEEISRRGHEHHAKLIRMSRQHARGQVAKALDLPQGSDVFHMLLVHFENGLAIQLEDRHVVADFAPACLEQDFEQQTPSAYLTSIAPLQEAEHVVRAQMPNAATRNHLSLDDNEPTLVVIRRTWTGGRPVTFTRLHHPASRFELAGRYSKAGNPATSNVVQLETLDR